MIGNDIVDLQHTLKVSDWQRPRFLDKVFTKAEQTIIFSSKNTTQTVWLLWSMKEAAYKLYVQEFGRRFFNPKTFQCELQSLTRGKVVTKQSNYITISEYNTEYIHTIATKHSKDSATFSIFNTNKPTYKFQSRFIKQKLLNHLSKGAENNTLNIIKDKLGVPQVFNGKEKLPISFSLSHCGKYTAFSILNN